MENKIITDSYGDTLAVEQMESVDDRIFIAVEEAQPDHAIEATVALTHDQARELAEDLLFRVSGLKQSEGGTINVVRLDEAPFNEALLEVAAAQKRAVTFRYAKEEGQQYIESRTLYPSKLVGTGDARAALGYDPDREETRRFRLDRIKGEVAFA